VIYDVNGQPINNPHSISGDVLDTAYDIGGSVIYRKDPYIPGRILTFEDDFDGNALDLSKWGYELGYGGSNPELEQYWKRCVSVEDGSLVLTARKVDDTGTIHQSWESGSVTTQDLFSQTYGRFEAKIKFPNVVGAFPAFWMVGTSLHHTYQEGERWSVTGHWPACGEVDIVEMIPGNAKTAQANLWDSSTLASNPVSLGAGRSQTYDPAQWNVYACEWTDAYMAMLLNGVEYKRYTWADFAAARVSAYTGAEEMKIKLNLAVGASGGTPAASTSEMKIYVDWVRVYAPLT